MVAVATAGSQGESRELHVLIAVRMRDYVVCCIVNEGLGHRAHVRTQLGSCNVVESGLLSVFFLSLYQTDDLLDVMFWPALPLLCVGCTFQRSAYGRGGAGYHYMTAESKCG